MLQKARRAGPGLWCRPAWCRRHRAADLPPWAASLHTCPLVRASEDGGGRQRRGRVDPPTRPESPAWPVTTQGGGGV